MDAPLANATEIPTDEDAATWLGDRDAGTDWSVAVAGGVVFVGQPSAARVRLFDGELQLVSEITSTTAEFGAAVAATERAGRVDLWVGAPADERGRGLVLYYPDVLGTPEPTPMLQIRGSSPFDRLGASIVVCPDRTGDGQPDLVLPSPTFQSTEEWPFDPVPELAGAVFHVDSEQMTAGDEPTAVWELGHAWWGSVIGEGAGTAVACDPAMVAVGAPWWRRSGERGNTAVRGRVTVVEGVPDSGPLEAVGTVTIEGRAADEWFGAALAALSGPAGRHLAVGGPGHASGDGRVSVYTVEDVPTLVSTLGPPPAHSFPDHFGRALHAVDLDGDGVDNLLVASFDHRTSRNDFDVGRLWGFSWATLASDQATANDAGVDIAGRQAFERVGRTLAAGDTDGDGERELWMFTRAPTP